MKKTLIAFGIVLTIALTITFVKTKSRPVKKNELSETSTQPVDTIFLGYCFGQTKKSFDKHTAELKKNGTLKPSGEYIFPVEPYDAEATIHPTFSNDKLTSLELQCGFEKNIAAPISLITYPLLDFYYDKYGSYKEDLMQNKIFKKSNLKIEFIEYTYSISINYIDTISQYNISKHEEAIQKEKEKLTKTQI